MKRLARAWAVTSAAALLFVAAPARAEPSHEFDLSWSAPPGCPTREKVIEATRARLGETRGSAPPDLFVQGTVTEDRDGFLVQLALTDTAGRQVGERSVRVEGKSCQAVTDPAALVLAMVIAVTRPKLAAAPPPSEPPQGDGPALAVAASPPPSPKPAVANEAPRPETPAHDTTLMLGVAGTSSLGVLPAVGFGVAARAVLSPWRRLHFGLEGTFEIGGAERVGSGEIGFQFVGASAIAGLEVLRARGFELILTLDARVGVVRILPRGFAVVQNDARTAALAGVGVLGRARIAPHVFAEVFPAIDAVLIRDQFQIRDGSKLYPVHRPDVVAARLSLGFAYEFR